MRRIVMSNIILFLSMVFLVSCRNKEVRRTYYENGQLESESETSDGVTKDGIGRAYFENGTVKYEGNYKDNFREGLHVAYYPNGVSRKAVFYSSEKGREYATRTIEFNQLGDTISDFKLATKRISIEIKNKQPYKVNDVLSIKLKIEDAKHRYSEAIFGNFGETLNIRSDPEDFSREIHGNENHEIFMNIQVIKPGPDTLTWLIRDYDFKYRTDTTGTSYGYEAYFGFPIHVFPR